MNAFLRTTLALALAGVLAPAANAGPHPQDTPPRLSELEALAAADTAASLALAREMLAETSADSDAHLAARVSAADCLIALQRFEEAHEAAARAVRATRAAASPRLGSALTTLGIALFRTGSLPAALSALEEAAALARTPAHRVRTLNALGLTHSSLGDFDRAAATFERALTIADESGLHHPSVRLRANIGNLYNELGRFDQALSILDEALERRAQNAATLPRFAILGGQASALRGLGRLDEALELQTLALEEVRAAGDRRAEASALNILGSVQLDAGRPFEALTTLRAALTLSKTLGLERARARILVNLTRAQLALQEVEAAYASAQLALSAAETSGSVPARIDALEALAECANLTGRHPESALHLEQALALERERRSIDRGDLALLERTLENQERARRMELDQKHRELELERSRAERFQRDVFAIALVLVVLMGVVGWSVWSLRRAARERIFELERLQQGLQAECSDREAELASVRQALDDMAHILPRCAGCGSVRKANGVWEAIEGLRRAPLHADPGEELCPRCWQRALDASPRSRRI